MTEELATPSPSSLKATAPASTMAPISASSLPSRPLVMQPTASTRAWSASMAR